jgi:hypothetical protein
MPAYFLARFAEGLERWACRSGVRLYQRSSLAAALRTWAASHVHPWWFSDASLFGQSGSLFGRFISLFDRPGNLADGLLK